MNSKSHYTCEAFGRCGGCSALNMSYQLQLERKNAKIKELYSSLLRNGALVPGAIRPIDGMDDPYRYRNKVIAPFVPQKRRKGKGQLTRNDNSRNVRSDTRDRNNRRKAHPNASTHGNSNPILTGMYARRTHEVIAYPSRGCILENPVAHDAVEAVRAIMQKHDVVPYDEDAGTGFMRHVVVRVGHGSGEVLVTLVTNSDEFPYAKSFCRELVRRVPAITTVVQSVNMRQTNVVLGEQEHVLYGPGFILDDLCGLRFRISAHSFYQVNATQTEVLYEQAIDLARLSGNEVVLDTYCGTGTIGLVAASRGADHIIGVDNSVSAIRDARLNAKHNGIKNAEFMAADASEFMRTLAAKDNRDTEGKLLALPTKDAAFQSTHSAQPPRSTYAAYLERPMVLFMDPPRAGSTSEFIDAISHLRPSRIVYVSCNPKTQVRDLEQICTHGYAIDTVQPVDMFPHTPHIECIASLERRI